MIEVDVRLVVLHRLPHPVLIINVQFWGVVVYHGHRLVGTVPHQHHGRAFQPLEHVPDLLGHLVLVLPTADQQRRLKGPLLVPSIPLVLGHEPQYNVVPRHVADVQRPGVFAAYILQEPRKARRDKVDVPHAVVAVAVRMAADKLALEQPLQVRKGRAAEEGTVGDAPQQRDAPHVAEGLRHVLFCLFVLFRDDLVDDYAGDGDVVLLTEDAVELFDSADKGMWESNAEVRC